MENVADVQVMSGFSGFMYGIGNSGGTQNYNLKRPTKDFQANGTVGDYGGGQYHADIDMGGPIKEGIMGYRLNLMKEDGNTAVDKQKISKSLFSLALDLKPVDKLLLQGNIYYGKSRMDGLQSGFSSYGTPTLVPNLDNSKLWAPTETYLDVETLDFGLGAKYEVSDALLFRAAWNHKDTKLKGVSSSNYDINWSGDRPMDYKMWTSARASQSISDGGYAYFDGLFETYGIKHKVTTGFNGYFSTSKIGIFRNPDGSRRVGIWGDDVPINWGDHATAERYNVPDYFASYDGLEKNAENTNYNFMIGDVIDFNEQWTLMAGVNYATISTKGFNAVSGIQSSQYRSHAITPTVSLLFKPTPSVTTYATYIQSLEPGIVVGSTYKNAGEVLAPTKSTEYELGVKAEIPGGALLGLALYHLDIGSTMSDDGTIYGRMTQDGRQVHRGLDMTITGKVSDHVTLVGGYSYVDAKYKKTADKDLEGQSPWGVPRHIFKMYAEYDMPYVPGLVLTGGFYYNGKSQTTSPASGVYYPGYALVDLGARYSMKINGVDTTFRLSVLNATNKNQWSYGDFNAPRTYALTASFGL
jgi:iron complex outermembrane receptor protein